VRQDFRLQNGILAGGDRFGETLRDGIGGGIAFEAPVLAARAGTAIGDDQRVPDFAGVVEVAAAKLAVEDDATTNARSEREHHHVAHVTSGTGGELAIGGGVGVVLNHAAEPGGRLHAVAERDVHEAGQIGSVVAHSPFVRHRPGGAPPAARALRGVPLGAPTQRVDEFGHAADDVVGAALGLRVNGVPGDQRAMRVTDAALDIGAAEIDTDGIRRRHVPVRSNAFVPGRRVRLIRGS